VNEADTVRILGLDLCSDLSWTNHILGLAKRTRSKLGFLNRCRKFFSSQQVLQIYKSMIRPCIEYCSHVWGGGPKTALNRLDSIQRRAVRIIRNDSITKNLDPLQHRRDVADLTIFYQYFHGLCSKDTRALMPSSKQYMRTTRESSSAHKFCVELKTSRTVVNQSDFFTRTALKWNELPPDVFPNTCNVQSFKERVNRHLRLFRTPLPHNTHYS
jgi:hypothetical protein